MRETCTYGSMSGSRRKTAKSVLRVVEDRAGVPDNKGRSALLYTLLNYILRSVLRFYNKPKHGRLLTLRPLKPGSYCDVLNFRRNSVGDIPVWILKTRQK